MPLSSADPGSHELLRLFPSYRWEKFPREKAAERKSHRWVMEELLSPACYFTAFPKPMLLTNSTSQHWAPSAGLSRYQWLKATHGTCPAIVPVSQRKNIRPTELMPAVLCSGNLNSQTSGVRSELFPAPCCYQGFWDSLWTQVWQIIDTLLRTSLICLSAMRTGVCYTFSYAECRILWISGTVGTGQLISSPVLSMPKAAFAPPSFIKPHLPL